MMAQDGYRLTYPWHGAVDRQRCEEGEVGEERCGLSGVVSKITGGVCARVRHK